MAKVRPEEWEILRRSTVMVSPQASAPLSRRQALELFDELDRLATLERRLVPLVSELLDIVATDEERDDSERQ